MGDEDFWQKPKELAGVTSDHQAQARTLEFLSEDEIKGSKVVVPTPVGECTVYTQGDRADKPIITCHEVGLNHRSCFKGFLAHAEAEPVLRKFCFYHICFPGQDTQAADIERFPTLDELATHVGAVAAHFKMPGFVGIGVGAGANVLLRYAARNEGTRVHGLLLVAPLLGRSGWLEWGFGKVQSSQAKFTAPGEMPAFAVEQYLKTYFSPTTMKNNHDLVQMFRQHLLADINVHNLSLFQNEYSRRTDLTKVVNPKTFSTPALMVYGGQSRHTPLMEEVIQCFPPDRFSYVQYYDAGDMVHEERPDEVMVAFKLFLKGLSLMF